MRATQRIWITNAYFIPGEHLLRGLCEAAWSGIDVRILLTRDNNHAFMGWATTTFYEKLLKCGVHIYEYEPSMLHAKTLIIDDWITVGSTNLNSRSIFHDFEIDVVLNTATAKRAIENQFLTDLAKSQRVRIKELKYIGWWRRCLGHIILLVRHWI